MFFRKDDHLFEDTNSKGTVLHRSADAILETETLTRETVLCKKKKKNYSINLVFLSKWREMYLQILWIPTSNEEASSVSR